MRPTRTEYLISSITTLALLVGEALAQQAGDSSKRHPGAGVASSTATPTPSAAPAYKEAGQLADNVSLKSTYSRKTNFKPVYQTYNFNGAVRNIDFLGIRDAAAEQDPKTTQPDWHYGVFLDVAYLFDFNHPSNDIFRSRGTTWHVDDLHLNMASAYVKKDKRQIPTP